MDILNILLVRAEDLAADLVESLPLFFIAALILLLSWGAATLVQDAADRFARRAGLRRRLAALLVQLSGAGVWAVGIMIALAVILPGLNAGTLVAGLGLASVAAAFIFNDIFENFLAGVLIMLRKKVRIGDLIRCEDMEGRIERITLRETHIRKLSNELIIAPNTFLFRNPVEVLTDAARRRYEITIRVSRQTGLEEAAELIKRALSSEIIAAKGQPEVFAREFTNGSTCLTVRWWAGSAAVDMHRSRDAVIRALKRTLDQSGVLIPFPQVACSFRQPLQLRRIG